MPKFIIERDIPGLGKLSAAELQGMSQKSAGVLRDMGSQIQWIHSYVTADKLYCVYIAPNESVVREHAARGKFPANKVSQITATIDPTTAEESVSTLIASTPNGATRTEVVDARAGSR